jgi:hypothetical protein
MAAKTRADDRDRATGIERYLPARDAPPIETSRLECLRGRLCEHGVEPPK